MTPQERLADGLKAFRELQPDMALIALPDGEAFALYSVDPAEVRAVLTPPTSETST